METFKKITMSNIEFNFLYSWWLFAMQKTGFAHFAD